MLYGSVVGLHAGAMVVALVLFVAAELLLLAARGGRRGTARMAVLAGRLARALVGVGVLAGIALVFLGGWSILTPWLIASLLLIVALMAVERALVRPWQAQEGGVLGDTVSRSQIMTFAGDRRALFGRAAMIGLFLLIAALMSAKPDLLAFI